VICWKCNHLVKEHIKASNGEGGCFTCYFNYETQSKWQHPPFDNLDYIEKLAKEKKLI
jgi:hypothetical protein